MEKSTDRISTQREGTSRISTPIWLVAFIIPCLWSWNRDWLVSSITRGTIPATRWAASTCGVNIPVLCRGHSDVGPTCPFHAVVQYSAPRPELDLFFLTKTQSRGQYRIESSWEHVRLDIRILINANAMQCCYHCYSGVVLSVSRSIINIEVCLCYAHPGPHVPE